MHDRATAMMRAVRRTVYHCRTGRVAIPGVEAKAEGAVWMTRIRWRGVVMMISPRRTGIAERDRWPGPRSRAVIRVRRSRPATSPAVVAGPISITAEPVRLRRCVDGHVGVIGRRPQR